MDVDYDRKFEEMKKYIPFLESMIKRLENTSSASNPRQAQLDKIRSLRDLLLDKKKRMKMENLLKCEQVLVNLYEKVEQRDSLPGFKKDGNSSQKEGDDIGTIRNKVKSTGSKSHKVNVETLPEIARASEMEEICVPGSKEPALFQRRPNKSSISPTRPLPNKVRETSPQTSKRNYTRVLLSPEHKQKSWSGDESSTEKSLYARRSPRKSPRRRSPSYHKKERRKLSKNSSKDAESKDLNITLNVPEDSLNSLNTKDILSRIINCSDNDVDINTLRELRTQILGELKDTGANEDISDIILKSYKKKDTQDKNPEDIEEGELSDSESEAIESIYGSLVVMDKDKLSINTSSKVSNEETPRKIQICLVINSDKNKSTLTKEEDKPTLPVVDISDFETFDNTKISIEKDTTINNFETNEVNKEITSTSVGDLNIALSCKKEETRICKDNEEEVKKQNEKDSGCEGSKEIIKPNFYKPLAEHTEEINESEDKINSNIELNIQSKDSEEAILKSENSNAEIPLLGPTKNVSEIDILQALKKEILSETNNVLSSDAETPLLHQPKITKVANAHDIGSKKRISIENYKAKTNTSLKSVLGNETSTNINKDDNSRKQSLKLTEKECERFNFPSRLALGESSDDEDKSLISMDEIYDNLAPKSPDHEDFADTGIKPPVIIPSDRVQTKVASSEADIDMRRIIPSFQTNLSTEVRDANPFSNDRDRAKTNEKIPTLIDPRMNKEKNAMAMPNSPNTYAINVDNSPRPLLNYASSPGNMNILQNVNSNPPLGLNVNVATNRPILSPNIIGNATPNLIPNMVPNLAPNLIASIVSNITPIMIPNIVSNIAPNMTPIRTPNVSNMTPNARSFEMTPSRQTVDNDDFLNQKHVYAPMFPDADTRDHNEKQWDNCDSNSLPFWEDARPNLAPREIDFRDTRNMGVKRDTDYRDVRGNTLHKDNEYPTAYEQYQNSPRNDRFNFEKMDPNHRLECPPTPSHPFGRIDCPPTPTPSFGRMDCPTTPTPSFGRLDCPPTPTASFGRMDVPMTPIHPFGRSECPPTPTHSFGRPEPLLSKQFLRNDFNQHSSNKSFGKPIDPRWNRNTDYDNNYQNRDHDRDRDRGHYQEPKFNSNFKPDNNRNNNAEVFRRYHNEQSLGRNERNKSYDHSGRNYRESHRDNNGSRYNREYDNDKLYSRNRGTNSKNYDYRQQNEFKNYDDSDRRSYQRERSVGRTTSNSSKRDASIGRTSFKDNRLSVQRHTGYSFTIDTSIKTSFQENHGRKNSFDARRQRAASVGRSLGRSSPHENQNNDSKQMNNLNKRNDFRRACSVGREFKESKLDFKDIKADLKSFKLKGESRWSKEITNKEEDKKAEEISKYHDPRSRKDLHKVQVESHQSNLKYSPRKNNRDPRMRRENSYENRGNYSDDRRSKSRDSKSYGIVYSNDNITKGTILGQGYGVKNYKIPKLKRSQPEPEVKNESGENKPKDDGIITEKKICDDKKSLNKKTNDKKENNATKTKGLNLKDSTKESKIEVSSNVKKSKGFKRDEDLLDKTKTPITENSEVKEVQEIKQNNNTLENSVSSSKKQEKGKESNLDIVIEKVDNIDKRITRSASRSIPTGISVEISPTKRTKRLKKLLVYESDSDDNVDKAENSITEISQSEQIEESKKIDDISVKENLNEKEVLSSSKDLSNSIKQPNDKKESSNDDARFGIEDLEIFSDNIASDPVIDNINALIADLDQDLNSSKNVHTQNNFSKELTLETMLENITSPEDNETLQDNTGDNRLPEEIENEIKKEVKTELKTGSLNASSFESGKNKKKVDVLTEANDALAKTESKSIKIPFSENIEADENVEAVKKIIVGDSVKAVENGEVRESVKVVQNVEVGESVKAVKNVEAGESVKAVEKVEVGESIKAVENVDVGKSVKAVENVEAGECFERIDSVVKNVDSEDNECSEAIVSTSGDGVKQSTEAQSMADIKDNTKTKPDSTITSHVNIDSLESQTNLPDSTNELNVEINSTVTSTHTTSQVPTNKQIAEPKEVLKKIKELLGLLGEQSKLSDNEKIKRKLEKLNEIVSDDEENVIDENEAERLENKPKEQKISEFNNSLTGIQEKETLEIVNQDKDNTDVLKPGVENNKNVIVDTLKETNAENITPQQNQKIAGDCSSNLNKLNDEENLVKGMEEQLPTTSEIQENVTDDLGNNILTSKGAQSNQNNKNIISKKRSKKSVNKVIPVKEKRLTRSDAANLHSDKPVVKKPSRELQKLQEDIREMFIRDDILSATGIRMCRLAKLVDDTKNQKDETSNENSNQEPIVVLEKCNDLNVSEDSANTEKISKKNMRKGKKKQSESNPSTDIDKISKNKITNLGNNSATDVKTKSKEHNDDVDPYVFETDSLKETNDTSDNKTDNKKSDSENESLSSSKSFGSSELLAEVKKKVKRKRGGRGWQAGIIKSKNKKKTDRKTDPALTNDESIEITKKPEIPDLNCFTDKSYCFSKSTSAYDCRLCSYNGTDIVYHYKKEHPHSEIPLSRMSPDIAKIAIKESEKINFQAICKISSKKFTCRFCFKEFGRKKPVLELFFWHVVSNHTGEYKQLCSECLNVTRCPFKLDIPPPPKDNKGQLLGYVCEKCNYTQVSLENLKTHVIMRHNDEQTAVYTINLSTTTKNITNNFLTEVEDVQNVNNEQTLARVLRSSRSSRSIGESSNVRNDLKDETPLNVKNLNANLVEKEIETKKNAKASNFQSKITFENDNTDDIFDENERSIKIEPELNDSQDSHLDNSRFESDLKAEQFESSSKSKKTDDSNVSNDIFNYPHFKIKYSESGSKEYICCINGKDLHYKTTLLISFKKHVQLKHSENWDGYCYICKVIVTPQGAHLFKDCLQHFLDQHMDSFPLLEDTSEEVLSCSGRDVSVKAASENATTKPYINVRPLSELISKESASQPAEDSVPILPIIESVVSLGTGIEQPRPSPSYPKTDPVEVVKQYKHEEAQAEIMSRKHRVVLEAMMTEVKLVQVFKCAGRFCSFTTDSAEDALLHASTHTRVGGEDSLKCVYCDFDSSSNAIDLITHVFKNHGCCQYICGMCFYRAAASQLVNAHIKRVHADTNTVTILYSALQTAPIQEDNILSRESAVPYYLCCATNGTESCKFKTYTPGKFCEHLQIRHSNAAEHTCFLCSTSLPTPADLIRHLKSHGLKLYQCTWCIFGADNETELLTHASANHPDKQPKAYLRIITNKVHASHFICHPCWQKVDRAAKRYSAPSSSRSGVSSNQLRCANCGINLIRQRRNILNNNAILLQIQERVAPQVVTANDYICDACHTLLVDTISTNSQASQDAVTIGHQHVCLTCGVSIARTRRHSLKDIDHNVSDVVQNWILPREEGTSEFRVLPLAHLNKSDIPATEVKASSSKENPVREAERSIELEKLIGHTLMMESMTATTETESPENESACAATDMDLNINESDVKNVTLLEERVKQKSRFENASSPVSENQSKPTIKTEVSESTSGNSLTESNVVYCLDSDEEDSNKKIDTPSNQSSSNTQVTAQLQPKRLPITQLFLCAKCNIVVKCGAGFKKHVMACFSQIPDPVPCAHCSLKVNKKSIVNHYTKIHAEVTKNYVCSKCPNKFTNVRLVREHERNDHPVSTANVLNAAVTTNTKPAPRRKRSLANKEKAEEPPEKVKRFGPLDVNLLPINPILDDYVFCSLCEFGTKVRLNMVRHLQLHAEQQIVPQTAPVNPVPHLETNEKHFDRMLNLASSSIVSRTPEKKRYDNNIITPMIPPEAVSRYPKYVPERHRHTCGAKDCSYISVDESMFKCHWETLHSGTTEYRCVHCPPHQQLDTSKALTAVRIIAHLKMHNTALYACSLCSYYHYKRQIVEKHLSEIHKSGQVMVVREEGSPVPVTTNQPQISAPTMDLKPWLCGLCKFKSLLRPEIVDHCAKVHNSKMQYKCAYCAFRTSNSENITKHQYKSHPDKKEEIFYYYYREGSVPEYSDGIPLWQRQSQKCDVEQPSIKTEMPGDVPQSSQMSLPLSNPLTTEVDLNLVKKEAIEVVEETIEDLCKDFGEFCEPNGLKYKCPLCKNVVEDNVEAMQSHLYEELKYRKWGCSICSYKAFHKAGLSDHMRVEHRQNKEPIALQLNNRVETWVAKLLDHQTQLIDKNKDNLAKQKVEILRSAPGPSRSISPPKQVEQMNQSSSNDNSTSKTSMAELKRLFGSLGASVNMLFCCPKCYITLKDEDEMKNHLESELNKIRWFCSNCSIVFQTYHEAQFHCRSVHIGQSARPTEAPRDPALRSAWVDAVIHVQKLSMCYAPLPSKSPGNAEAAETQANPPENSLLVVRYEERIPTPEEQMARNTPTQNLDSDDDKLVIDEPTETRKVKTKKCLHCEYTTLNSRVLRDHVLRHYNLKPYSCAYCSVTGSRKSLEQHHTLVHENEPIKLLATLIPTDTPADYLQRLSSNALETTKLICLVCRHEFTGEQTTTHKHDRVLTSFGKKGEVVVKCSNCFTLHKDVNAYFNHHKSFHESMSVNYVFTKLLTVTAESIALIYACSRCDQKFQHFKDLKIHADANHKNCKLLYTLVSKVQDTLDSNEIISLDDDEDVGTKRLNKDVSNLPPSKKMAKKSTTKLPLNKSFARKSTTKLPFAKQRYPKEFSYYGSRPTTGDLDGVTTMMSFCNTMVPFTLKKLSEVINIDPVVRVEKLKDL